VGLCENLDKISIKINSHIGQTLGKTSAKTSEFQQKHKYSLLYILMEAYEHYRKNDRRFIIPESLKQRTTQYLELSYNIVQWFKERYDKTKRYI
jgi:hypothetical protein